MWQQIEELLKSLGMGGYSGGYSSLSGIEPETIQQALINQFDLPEQDVPTSLFQPLSKQGVKAGQSSTYSPEIEAAGHLGTQTMLESLQGKTSKKAFGGFEGSGQQRKYMSGIKDEYGKNMVDVLTNVSQKATTAQSGIVSQMQEWINNAMRIKGNV